MSKKVRRLYEQFQPVSYALELEPDRESMRFRGSLTIIGQKAGRPSQRLTFHQHGLKITTARIKRIDKRGNVDDYAVARINHHASFDEVRLHTDRLLYPGSYEVALEFSGGINDGMHGIYPCYYELDGKRQSLIATQFESHHAREAFPCIDEPEAKATFDLSLITPAGETALSNMPPAAQTERDGKLTTIFQTTPRMPTYLLAFVFGGLQCKKTTTDSGVEVRTWATKAQPAAALDFALGTAKRAIEFFDNYFGVPYPLSKCDHVALPDFSAGAMENWGLITYRETALLADEKTATQSSRELVATVIAHETSHQWFGNLVTMRWWDDLWLNESFANVMEYIATDALFPEWHIWNSFVAQEGLAAIRRDAIAGVQAVRTGVHHPDEISSLFDPSIVYAKGGRLLNMLIQYLGEDDFRKGLKQYFSQHAYGNTTGDDLWAALSEASGKDVAAFMNPWLERSGFPLVQVAQNGAEVRLRQSHFLLDPTKADSTRVWPVPLFASDAALPALLHEREAAASASTKDYVRINQGAVGHYVVHYTDAAHRRAIDALVAKQRLTVPERLMLLNDSAMLARAGKYSFTETLRLLQQYRDEPSEPVWDIMALVLADCRRFADGAPELETRIKAFVRTLIAVQFQRLGWEQAANESTDDTKLRATIIGLGVYAQHPTITKRAIELFGAYRKDPTAVTPELRGIVLGAAVRNKVPGAFEFLLDQEEHTNNVDLKQDFMDALTLAQTPAQTETLLGRFKDPAKVRQQDIGRWLAYLLRNRHSRAQTWQWLRDNWEWLEQTFSGDKSYDYFPRYAAGAFNSRQLLDEYRAFFEPMRDQPALARNITMGIEELENRVAWLERDRASVAAYFADSGN